MQKNRQASEQAKALLNKSLTSASTLKISSTQQELHNVLNFKKAFDMVWHDVLWSTMRQFHIGSNSVTIIKQLYNEASSAVCIDVQLGEWFFIHSGVRQGCLLSPTLFNVFLKRLISEVLEDHVGHVSIGGRAITNLRLADDFDSLGSNEEELKAITECTDRMANHMA